MRISTVQINQAGLREILARQTELANTQLQLSTQRQFLTAADNPIGAVTSLALESEIALIDQFQRNTDSAEAGNALEESVLTGVTNTMFRVRELMVTIGNGTYTANELDAIKFELEARLEELVGLANTQNASGDYLFSGFQANVRPFSQDAAGNFIYNGDQGQRELQISSSVRVPISDSGFDIFVDTLTGDGQIETDAAATNTGSGIIEPRGLSGIPFITNGYEVRFTSDTTYDFVDLGPPVAVVGSANYVEGGDISFANITVGIEGAPENGDVFTIAPSQRQSLFTSISEVINEIDTYDDSSAGRAQFRSRIVALDGALKNAAENIDLIRAQIGARLNTIEGERDSNANVKLIQQTTLSDIRDLDVVEAASRLSQQINVLEAAQASFVRVQNLNIFNFL